MLWKLKIDYKTEVEAESEEEAIDEFFNLLNKNNETAETFLSDNIAIGENNCRIIGQRG